MTLTHLHLDCLGGIAGDMFNAAMLDAFPEHQPAATAAATAVAGVACSLLAHRDSVLTGSRFEVAAHTHDDHDHDHHHHTTWRDIRARIERSALPPAVRTRAVAIFAGLAQAEAGVHGIAEDAVSFHEVGSADSVADIVAAAWLIHAMGDATWSVGKLPLGGGRVRTAHGMLPVPAPATARLLEGFAFVDDGVDGERVTPTGAAILRHLAPQPRRGLAGRMVRSGIGFGTRTWPGMSNVVRVLAFEADAEQPRPGTHRDLAVIGFEVDDQSPEDLATGLDRLRARLDVHDAVQFAAVGKKGRMAAHVQVLARPDALDAVVEACFRETTTIGLRTHLVQGRALPRDMREVSAGGRTVRVKCVERPGGWTAKAESDDMLAGPSHAERAALRREAERAVELPGRG